MKLLLVNPKSPESFWSLKWAVDVVLPHKRSLNPPLGLATLAALCPQGWEVSIVDENIEAIPLRPEADIIGICGMGVQFPRQRELLTYYRSKGFYVVAGGSYASLCPELYAPLADTVVAGEAEYTWREFCRDIESNEPKPLYQESGTVSLADSPVPRFDLLQLDKYQTVSLQFSRGCPFRCEFCDIIVMFGRRPRTKSVEQVGRELDLLRRRNVRNAFFVDDNFIGNKPAAKELLEFLRDYQRDHDYDFRFGTEASINLAHDEELLELFRQANFAWVFIGIESPDADSLKETRKYQNTRRDLLSSVRRIYSEGIDVLGGFIVGFDNDTIETFGKQYEFIMQSGIQTAMVGLLTALPKTPLYERLRGEGRLIAGASGAENTRLATNVIPKRMGYDELIAGYRTLLRRLVRYDGIAGRIRNKVRYLTHPVVVGGAAPHAEEDRCLWRAAGWSGSLVPFRTVHPVLAAEAHSAGDAGLGRGVGDAGLREPPLRRDGREGAAAGEEPLRLYREGSAALCAPGCRAAIPRRGDECGGPSVAVAEGGARSQVLRARSAPSRGLAEAYDGVGDP
jgi:radical SAM superfamily enzyme YgiQ (UPF0313 family)